MIPIIASGAFTSHQIIDYRIDWFDSSMSVDARGLGFRLFNPQTNFTTTSMQNAVDPTTYIGSGTAVLTNSGTWGFSPLVSEYWGSGAPAGLTRARFVSIHWRGFAAADRSWAHTVGTTSSFWLCFNGQGFIRVQVNGSDVLNTRLNYSTYNASTLITANTGDRIDIYYWQLGEPWGGIVGKYVVQRQGQSSSSTAITDSQYREAPVISASLFPYSTATATTLPEVMTATLEIPNPSDTASLVFTLPLSNQESSIGWKILQSPRRLRYTDISGNTYTLKRRQLIKFYGGFKDELYNRFTGYIHDFEESDGEIKVECQDISYRMSKVNIENYPDKNSYGSFGYFKQFSVSEPVYDITAYDNWPLEHAIKDLCYKAGIDPKLFYSTLRVNNINGTITDITDDVGNSQYYVSAKSISGDLLRLQRPARYGNSGSGFSSDKPSDDEYIYTPNVSRSVLDWSREIADSLGYDFRFNSAGNLVLGPRNNPQRYSKVTSGTQKFGISSIKGTYREITSPFSESKTLNGGRFDLVVGRESTLGAINYSVNIMSGIQVASGTINLALAGETSGVFYYDNRFSVTGSNIAIFSLYTGKWGKYTVTLANNSGAKWWLDSIVVYDDDPTKNILPQILLTDQQVQDLRTQSFAEEAVNNVVVIGKRKSNITDSLKFRNPNNPQAEFYVARGVDPSSIWDGNTSNYVGGKVSTLIIDNKISDQDYANWAAQMLLTRQRDPGPSANITHTILPFLEPRDPINVSDQTFRTITGSDLVWITSITESYTPSEATSSINTTAYSQVPSYDPRQDLDADTIDSTFFGQPIINFSVTYPSIDSGTITNPGPTLTNAKIWGYSDNSYLKQFEQLFSGAYSVDANGTFLNFASSAVWPPVPDSISFGTNIVSESKIYKNNPYMKFWHIFNYDSKKIHLPCLAADGTSSYTISGSLGPSHPSYLETFKLFTPYVSFKGLDSTLGISQIYSGVCPFFDPYMSELPDANLITVNFDALTSGYYRVSIWDARNQSSPTLVGWLTEPSIDDANPELHWTYLTASKNIKFLWDGVDSIGTWNKKQSETYAWTARGWFENDQKPEIGKGFYVWNDQTSEIVTISGQKLGGKLTFNPDHYSQFYIKIECTNDSFAAKATLQDSTTSGSFNFGGNLSTRGGKPNVDFRHISGPRTANSIRTVNSNNLKGAPTQNTKPSVYIYTHLPPPSSATITTIEDWDYKNTGAFDYLTSAFGTTGWVTSGDYAYSFRNDKPVRITLQAIARPGGRFSGNRAFTTFKVHRVSHLNVNILDSFMLFEGEPWNPKTSIEKKRLVNRRLTNAQHTVAFVDTDWRTGDTLDLSNTKWIFRPQDFRVDNQGVQEPIEFCNYLQIEDLPGYSRTRTIGQAQSRLILAYLSYVFYLSVYTQDRSGRMMWAVDSSFVDKSKILNNNFGTDQPEDTERYSNRTIVSRQWVDVAYKTTLANVWQISSSQNGRNPQDYIQFFHNRLDVDDNVTTDPLTIDINGTSVNGSLFTGYTDKYSEYHRTEPSYNKLPTTYLTNRQLGEWVDSGNSLTNYFGKWTWEGDQDTSTAVDPLWIPDLTRDFHPYFILPPMPTRKLDWAHYWYSQTVNDEAETEIWFSNTFPMNEKNNYDNGITKRRFRYPGISVEKFTDPAATSGDKFVKPIQFNYTRQIEWMHWEDYRGFVSSTKLPSRSPIYVTPGGGAYLQNSHRYINFTRLKRDITVEEPNNPASDISAGVDSVHLSTLTFPIIYEVDIKTGNARDRGFFTLTFRHKYNWYSSSYFPTNSELKILPRYLYPKYATADVGQPDFFDTGAWVGWKDDLDSSATTINWVDQANPNNSQQSTTNNIFLTQIKTAFSPVGLLFNNSAKDRMALALGPRLRESIDIIINLALINNRRFRPISGI